MESWKIKQRLSASGRIDAMNADVAYDALFVSFKEETKSHTFGVIVTLPVDG
jgi:hypothetical protein